MSEYVSLDGVLNALGAVKAIEGQLHKGDIVGEVRRRVLHLERGVETTLIAPVVETAVPAIPYSVISRPAWKCGRCFEEVWYKDQFCRHCGAKLEGKEQAHGHGDSEAAEGV